MVLLVLAPLSLPPLPPLLSGCWQVSPPPSQSTRRTPAPSPLFREPSSEFLLFTPKLSLRSHLSPVVLNVTKLWEATHSPGG